MARRLAAGFAPPLADSHFIVILAVAKAALEARPITVILEAAAQARLA